LRLFKGLQAEKFFPPRLPAGASSDAGDARLRADAPGDAASVAAASAGPAKPHRVWSRRSAVGGAGEATRGFQRGGGRLPAAGFFQRLATVSSDADRSMMDDSTTCFFQKENVAIKSRSAG
jgi:hypothetical protein